MKIIYENCGVKNYMKEDHRSYMKILYESCGVKNYMKEDHCSCRRNFCSREKKAWQIDNLCNGHFQTQFDSKIGYHIGCDV